MRSSRSSGGCSEARMSTRAAALRSQLERGSAPRQRSERPTTRLTQGDPMRKLVVNTFMSLDGVMQAPGGPDEDPTGGFTHGGWAANYFDEEMMGQMAQADPYE